MLAQLHVRTAHAYVVHFRTTRLRIDPFLFFRDMYWLMNQYTDNFGIHVGDHLVPDMDYADDAVLFNTESVTWNEISKNCDSVANSLGMLRIIIIMWLVHRTLPSR